MTVAYQTAAILVCLQTYPCRCMLGALLYTPLFTSCSTLRTVSFGFLFIFLYKKWVEVPRWYFLWLCRCYGEEASRFVQPIPAHLPHCPGSYLSPPCLVLSFCVDPFFALVLYDFLGLLFFQSSDLSDRFRFISALRFCRRSHCNCADDEKP